MAGRSEGDDAAAVGRPAGHRGQDAGSLIETDRSHLRDDAVGCGERERVAQVVWRAGRVGHDVQPAQHHRHRGQLEWLGAVPEQQQGPVRGQATVGRGGGIAAGRGVHDQVGACVPAAQRVGGIGLTRGHVPFGTDSLGPGLAAARPAEYDHAGSHGRREPRRHGPDTARAEHSNPGACRALPAAAR